MPRKVTVDLDELKNFLDYLNDKVEDVYQRETTKAIKEYLSQYTDKEGGQTHWN
jgi:hypothetical protein